MKKETKIFFKKSVEENYRSWYDKYYRFLLLIPLVLTIISIIYLSLFFSQHRDFMLKDVTLSGGTTLTIQGDISEETIKLLKPKFSDIFVRKLTDIRTGHVIASIIETSGQSTELKSNLESVLGYNLTEENSSIEFSGPTLSEGFYKQLIIALLIAFILISIVVFILFRSFIPCLAIIFSIFSDIVIALSLANFIGLRLSTAGIAAFLMLVGYSIDTNILLTTRALKNKENAVNERIYHAFKTGSFMTLTSIMAILPAFFIVGGLPNSFSQIFLILAFGLFADLINTWLMNAGLIKLYCIKKGIN